MNPIRTLLAILTLGVSTLCLGAQTATKPVITLELAKSIAAKAVAEAVKNKWTMVIAIVDDGANLVYLEKIDGTQIGSITVAQEKAASAIKFKRPTKAFETALAGGASYILRVPGALPIEGGLPIVVNEVYIGAIGVSGGSPAQDGVVAAAALTGLTP